MEMLDKTLLSEEILQELLSEIFKRKVSDIEIRENEVGYYFADQIRIRCMHWKPDYFYINIYELIHLAKVKAKEYGVFIWSGYEHVTDDFQCTMYTCEDYATTDPFSADTEVNAVLKAFKWVLDNK